MLKELRKYVGRRVEIIYLDKKNRFTKREIEIRQVEGDYVKAYCFANKAPRLFHGERILAVHPLGRTHAV